MRDVLAEKSSDIRNDSRGTRGLGRDSMIRDIIRLEECFPRALEDTLFPENRNSHRRKLTQFHS